MSVIYKIIILQFLILPFYSSAQENKAKTINYEINFIPFQTAIVGNNKFTPILNEEYVSFDINLFKNQFRFLASKKLKNKWIGGIGLGFVQTTANWMVGFDKDNSSFFNSIQTNLL